MLPHMVEGNALELVFTYLDSNVTSDVRLIFEGLRVSRAYSLGFCAKYLSLELPLPVSHLSPVSQADFCPVHPIQRHSVHAHSATAIDGFNSSSSELVLHGLL